MVKDYAYPISITFDYVPAHINYPLILRFSEAEIECINYLARNYNKLDLFDHFDSERINALIDGLERLQSGTAVLLNTANEYKFEKSRGKKNV